MGPSHDRAWPRTYCESTEEARYERRLLPRTTAPGRGLASLAQPTSNSAGKGQSPSARVCPLERRGHPGLSRPDRHTVPNFLAPGDDVGRGRSVETRQQLSRSSGESTHCPSFAAAGRWRREAKGWRAGRFRYWLAGSVRGRPKYGSVLLSTNLVIALTRSPSTVSTSSPCACPTGSSWSNT